MNAVFHNAQELHAHGSQELRPAEPRQGGAGGGRQGSPGHQGGTRRRFTFDVSSKRNRCICERKDNDTHGEPQQPIPKQQPREADSLGILFGNRPIFSSHVECADGKWIEQRCNPFALQVLRESVRHAIAR